MSILGWIGIGITALTLIISTVMLKIIWNKNKKWVHILLVFIVVLVAALVAALAGEEYVAVINVLVLSGLVLITAEYVKKTEEIAKATKEQATEIQKQANASTKMATEMQNQRYDMVRPVIDFERATTGEELIAEGFAAKAQDYNHGLKCMLCNIGIGPAIDIYSFINPTYGTRQLHNFVTIAAGDIKTYGWNFHLEQRDNLWFLVA